MATTSKALESTRVYASPTRQRVMGVVFLAMALGIWLLFARQIEPGITTTFNGAAATVLVMVLLSS